MGFQRVRISSLLELNPKTTQIYHGFERFHRQPTVPGQYLGGSFSKTLFFRINERLRKSQILRASTGIFIFQQ